MINILIIEDDKLLSKHIKDILAPLGQITQVYQGDLGLFKIQSGQFDFVILDLMLPEITGLDILSKIRPTQPNLPILILTAKDSLEDKLNSFEIGADDYLTKPFHRDELFVRSKAILKRSLHLYDEQTLIFKDLTCYFHKREVIYKNKSLNIQGKEWDLLIYFIQNKDIILTKEQIFNRIWGFDSNTAITVVEVYISHLRKHLKSINYDDYLITIRNVGYLFHSEVKK